MFHVSYRLFILCLNSMPLNFTFEFLVTFFRDVAININENLLFSKFYTKFDKLFLKNEWTKIGFVNCVYCMIHLAFQP